MPAPAGAEEHDGAAGDRSGGFLERQHRLASEAIVPVRRRFLRDVDDDGRRDELLERNLVGGPAFLREVPRGVEVRAAVLGRAQAVGGIEPPARCGPAGFARQRELGGRRGPVERRRPVAMREVDHAVARQVDGLSGNGNRACDGEKGGERGSLHDGPVATIAPAPVARPSAACEPHGPSRRSRGGRRRGRRSRRPAGRRAAMCRWRRRVRRRRA